MDNCPCATDEPHLDGLCPIDWEVDLGQDPLPPLDQDDPDEAGTPVDDEDLTELLDEEADL